MSTPFLRASPAYPLSAPSGPRKFSRIVFARLSHRFLIATAVPASVRICTLPASSSLSSPASVPSRNCTTAFNCTTTTTLDVIPIPTPLPSLVNTPLLHWPKRAAGCTIIDRGGLLVVVVFPTMRSSFPLSSTRFSPMRNTFAVCGSLPGLWSELCRQRCGWLADCDTDGGWRRLWTDGGR